MISYSRLTDQLEACQWIIDVFPMTKLRLAVEPIAEFKYEAGVHVHRVNPDNENTPLEPGVWVSQHNGTEVDLIGTIFVVTYYEKKPEGKGFLLKYQGLESAEFTSSFEHHIVRNPNSTISTSTYQFRPNQFTSILVRGPIYNHHASYLHGITLQYYDVLENCGRCILSVSSIYSSISSSYDVRSFYGSSRYTIPVKGEIFGPMLVTIKRLGAGAVEHGLNFKLDWGYFS